MDGQPTGCGYCRSHRRARRHRLRPRHRLVLRGTVFQCRDRGHRRRRDPSGGPVRDGGPVPGSGPARRTVADSQGSVALRSRPAPAFGGPLIAFTFVIGPLTSLLGQRAQGNSIRRRCRLLPHREVRDADTGPMWFVTALLVFSIAYGSWRWARPAGLTASGPLRPGHLVAAAAGIVVGSFVVRLKWPFTADTPFDLNLWEWPQMATLFALGALAGERGWLDPIPDRLRRACGRASIVGALGLLFVVAAVGLAGDEDPFLGGWHLQALAEPTAEATIAVAMSFWLVGWFAVGGTTRARWPVPSGGPHSPLTSSTHRSSSCSASASVRSPLPPKSSSWRSRCSGWQRHSPLACGSPPRSVRGPNFPGRSALPNTRLDGRRLGHVHDRLPHSRSSSSQAARSSVDVAG